MDSYRLWLFIYDLDRVVRPLGSCTLFYQRLFLDIWSFGALADLGHCPLSIPQGQLVLILNSFFDGLFYAFGLLGCRRLVLIILAKVLKVQRANFLASLNFLEHFAVFL